MKTFEELHSLNEMATLSRPSELIRNTIIRVFGERDEQGTKLPHFHVVIGKGNDKIELEVKIQHIKQMEIWRTKRGYPKSWNGITDVRDSIVEWLDKKSTKRKELTNTQMIVLAWNIENPTNEIEDSYAL